MKKKWKYLFSLVISLIFIMGVFSINTNKLETGIVLDASTVKDNREFKAVWVSPLVGDAYLNGESTFKTNMTEVLNVMDYYGLNALIFHVRTHNNAFYPSSLNPKASFVSNINFDTFDPISWLIEESHKRGIEFHAWMNPYRYNTNYQTGSMPSANPQSNSSNTIEGSILNPSLSNVKNHIYSTINEFVTRYPSTDGIHFDDYFYVSTSASPTGADARRGHIDELISGIKTRLDSFNSANNTHVQFGISPTGIYKNGNGTVTYDANGLPITTGSKTSGQQHYGDYLYADTLKWMKEGWIDYIIPQVYWARNLSAAPFVDVLSWWDKVARYLDVNLYTGIGLYKSLETGGAGWYTNTAEMNSQYNIIENDMANVLGYAVFSFKHLKMAKDGDTGMVGKQVNAAYNTAARKAIKVLPEVKSMTPVIPGAVLSNHGSGSITWNGISNAKFYYIYRSSGTLTYSSDEIIGVKGHEPGVNSYTISNYNSSYNYGVRALSPTNHLSPIGAAPAVDVYDITYNLNGGSFDTSLYATREAMIVDFLTDFYNFLNPAVNLTTFMHGSGNVSGFDGLYNGDYFDQLFQANDKSINASTNKFINQPLYNKWVPLLDLMDEYTNKGYSAQTFWGSTFTAQRRIKPFIQQENLWEDDGEPKASTIMEIVNRIPTFGESSNSIYYQYTKNYPTIVLPEAIKEGSRFLGWYTENTGGSRITAIEAGSTGNKVFYARWELIEEQGQEFLVSFNLDYENKYLNPQTISEGSLALAPANPSREHYTFTGWYLNDSLFNFSMPITSNINLVAGWTFSSYVVKFTDHNGTILKEEIVLPGESAQAPDNPSRVGYTFMGWDISYRDVSSNLTVTAQYAIAKYFVEFVDSDGSIFNSLVVDYGVTVSIPSPPTKVGQTFIGWYLNNNPYNFSTPITSDIVLTAWWDSARFTVTFLNASGGVFTTQSVEESGKAVRPTLVPYKEGHSFNAWTLSGAAYNFNNAVTSDITLMPTFDILVRTVYFLNYDGSEIGKSNVNFGTRVARPSDPLRYGYTFIDWYLGDLAYNFDSDVYDETVSLVAKWEINMYTVIFKDYNGTTLNTQSIAHGSGAIAPVSPNNREGHTFSGWDRTFNNIVNYTVVTALYNPINMYVWFVDEDNSLIDTVTVAYGSKVTRRIDPYKEGYVFVGWLKDGNLFDFESLIKEDITLKASYDFGGHTVTYLNYGGSIFLQQTVNSGGVATKPTSMPYKEGYSFVSWNLGSGAYDFNTAVTSNITLTPSWTILVHTIRFLNDDNSLISSVNVNHEQRVSVPNEDPVKVGYSFIGWYLGDILYNFEQPVYENRDIKARYNISKYKVRFIDHDGVVLRQYSEVLYGESITPPSNPDNKVGHFFSHWSDSYTNITDDKDILAIYQKYNYFVTFYNYDGLVLGSELVGYEEYVTISPNVYREGYDFVGWLKDGSIFNKQTKITKDISLYADFQIKVYNVTYLNEGVEVLTENYDHGSNVVKPSITLTREGYSFTGWYLGQTLYNFTTSELVNHITLTAGWKTNSYTVTFLNANNAVFKTVTVEADMPVNKPTEVPFKEGYMFSDWLLNGVIYPFSMKVNSNITLTPSFNVIKYKVNFYVDSLVYHEVFVDHGSKVEEPLKPTKEGHSFVGWNLGDSLFNFLSSVYDPIDLKAGFNVNVYRVRFFDGDTPLKTEDVPYLGSATAPTAPAKVGYTFVGWNKTYDNITEDININALYEVSSYTVTFKDYEKVISSVNATYGKGVTAPTIEPREGYLFVGWDQEFNNITKDLIVNALYERISYAVKYYDYYDNILKEETVFHGEALTPPEVPVLEGAKFSFWLKDALNVYDISTAVKESLELYANYDINRYSVKFYDEDNKLLKEEFVLHGNPATAPDKPTKTGYVFAGWSESFVVVKEDLNIYARFVKEDTKTYSVKFYSDEVLIKEDLVNEFDKIVKPNDPTKQGYTFISWLKEGLVFDFNTEIKEDVILVANYEVNIYQITYYSDTNAVVARINANYDSIINVPSVPAKLGYSGVWEIDLTNIKVKKDYDIKAVYTLINYKITYHNIREAINDNPSTHTLTEAIILKDLRLIDESNGFVGWFDEADVEITVLAGPGDKVIYAKWEVNEYIVKFVDYAGSIIDTQTVKHGLSASEPVVPLREHYSFIGFDKVFTNVRSDLTITALYAGVSYTLTFNTNGGSTINFEVVTYPNLPVKPTNPTKTGYSFVGWYQDINLSSPFSFTKTITENQTIYAKFEINTYIVTFVDDKGSVIEQVSVNHGDTAVPKKSVLKEHYTHTGWDKSLVNITSSQTIMATFIPYSYKLSFNTLGGLVIKDESYPYPSIPKAPVTPTKSGYDFVGWYLDASYENRFNFNETLKENLTIYARWLEKLDDNKYISMYQNASIRYKTDVTSQGLRFYARINEDYKNNEKGFYLVYGKATVADLRLAITNKNGGNSFKINGKEVFKVVVSGADENNTFSVVLTGIPSKGYADELSVIGYVVVAGEEHFTIDASSRSVLEVALKSLNDGETNLALSNIVSETEKKVVLSVNIKGETELNNNYYEHNHKYLKKEFSNDYKKLLDKEYSGASISESDLKLFYSDLFYKEKWNFLLNYFLDISNNTNLNNQIKNIQTNKNNESLKELAYALSNFFNEENAKLSVEIIDFTNLDNYLLLKNYNNNVYINPNNYKLYAVGEKLTLEEVNSDLVGYDFDHYLINSNKYNELEEYIITNASVRFIKVFKEAHFTVTFMANSALYHEEVVRPYEKLNTLPTMYISGYEFLGWYTDANQLYDLNNEVTFNFTLQAKFVKINYINSVDIYINPRTYELVSKTDNVKVEIYFDYNYVDVIIKPEENYEFAHDIVVSIYFNDKLADVIVFTVNKLEINYTLDDPNYTDKY